MAVFFFVLLFSSAVFGSSALSDEVTDFEIELSALALDWKSVNAPILSTSDLLEHFRLSASCDSPLHALSKEGLESFIGGLVFTRDGLASWRYDVLAEELSDQQIYEVMKLFGRQYHNPLVDKHLLTPEEQLIRAATASLYGRIGVLQDHACATPRCAPLVNSTCDPLWCGAWTPPAPPPPPPPPWPPFLPTLDPSEIPTFCY